MRVLILHNRYREPGGEDSVVAAEALLLEQGGHTVHVHEVHNPDDPKVAIQGLTRSAWNRTAARQVEKLARSLRPDVVHVHNTWFSLSLAPLWALRGHSAARVVTLHNYRTLCVNASLYRDGRRCTDCVGHLPWRGVVHRCYRGSAAASAAAAANIGLHRSIRTWTTQVDSIIAPTSLARDLLVRGGLPGDLIKVKPHFVPDPGDRADPPSMAQAVVFAGRFSSDKGLVPVAEAWAASPPAGLELWFIGDGELGATLSTAGPTVKTLPWMPRSNLSDVLLRSRAVIVPTRMFETFGLTALEAMAAGTPILTVAETAVAEVVGGGGPPPVPLMPTVADWRSAITLLSDGPSVDAWGAEARSRYQQYFSPVNALDQLTGVYRAARATRRSRARVEPTHG